MGFVFIFCIIGVVIISLIEKGKGVKPNALEVGIKLFRMAPAFAAGALVICSIVAALLRF